MDLQRIYEDVDDLQNWVVEETPHNPVEAEWHDGNDYCLGCELAMQAGLLANAIEDFAKGRGYQLDV